MRLKFLLLGFAAIIFATSCSRVTPQPQAASPASPTQPRTFESYQRKAEKFRSVLALPQLETSADQVQATIKKAIAQGNAALDRIGRLTPEQVTFDNTLRALDDMYYEASLSGNRISLLKETSEKPEIRDAATEAIREFEEWSVGLDYREDVYAAVKAFEKKKPKLAGEDAKLMEETLRDYRRAGLELPKPQRQEVEKLRKELSSLTTDFDANITKAQKPVHFTQDELEGVPESFLQQTKENENDYIVMANITWHNQTVMENAKKEATRKKLLMARYTLAQKENSKLLDEIVRVRNSIARKLGYASWADYKIEPKMAKTAKTANDFLIQLKNGLEPKFRGELEQFRAMKARDTGDPSAQIQIWDMSYYSNQLKKEKYSVDSEALRVYFPLDQVMQGMFRVYEKIFALKIEPIPALEKWTDKLSLYIVSDSRTGEPLGCFYLDLFPREGKYNHFAQFGIIEGKLLRSGLYQRPTVSLICNFPPPAKDKPSLLTHDHVETLFHEFGHALHSIMTRAHYGRFSGTSVPRDFVEAPSQMLENWVWDKDVLDSFAADYRDRTKKIPQPVLSKLKEAKLATSGSFYRRQLTFGLIDLALHAGRPDGETIDTVKVSNEIFSQVLRPVPPETSFVTYFGHLTGYDGGYYGYAWADAIAADMATVFEKAPHRYFDTQAGLRLRNEIYSEGGARDVQISIEKFLGRKQSLDPFLKSIGIATEARHAEAQPVKTPSDTGKRKSSRRGRGESD